jgi:hypothetical protein
MKIMGATHRTLVPIFAYGIFRADIMRRVPAGWQHVRCTSVGGFTIYEHEDGGVAMARPKRDGTIEGDLWMVPLGDVIGYLDRVESHPHWYRRSPVLTSCGRMAEMYVMQEPVELWRDHVDIGALWKPERREPRDAGTTADHV